MCGGHATITSPLLAVATSLKGAHDPERQACAQPTSFVSKIQKLVCGGELSQAKMRHYLSLLVFASIANAVDFTLAKANQYRSNDWYVSTLNIVFTRIRF